MRALGRPCASTVAMFIAVGSGTAALIASLSQTSNCATGSGRQSSGESSFFA